MSMVTQCPKCSTAFNVTPEQLFARDGRVRCGHCKAVFDGLVNLTSLEALKAGTPPPLSEAKQAAQQPSMPAIAPAVEDGPGFSPLNWPMLPDVPVVPTPPLPMESAVESVQTMADVVAQSEATVAPTSRKVQPAPAVVAEELPASKPTSKRNRWPWALAAGIAALGLGAQVLYAYRSETAAHFPKLRTVLEQACASIPCTVPVLQRPAVLTIEALDLLKTDESKPHLVQLIVTLHNQSNLEVGYPAMDLALNDRFNHVVARRVLLPKDYLKGGNVRDAVIAAGVATTVRVDLDLSGLSAGGFNLLLVPSPET